MEAVYRSYYTRSGPIVAYMVRRLRLRPRMKILEPCAGDGAFVDAILEESSDVEIDLCEMNPAALAILSEKYGSVPRIRIIAGDMLASGDCAAPGTYDGLIGNPPYGGWQEPARRRQLKQQYPGVYVRETYSLFLYRCLDLLREGGRLVFIVPDTFLNLHLHTALRAHLLTRAKVEEIALFPSSFFPGVRFGYANLCVITLERCSAREACLGNRIRLIRNLSSPQDLLQPRRFLAALSQRDWFENVDHALFLADDRRVSELLNRCSVRIGDMAACVTGFYSGDDRRFLRAGPEVSRRYGEVKPEQICDSWQEREDMLAGIDGPRPFVPIVKGGGQRYVKPDRWFLDWSTRAVRHYRSDRKARFQNSRFYFSDGIGVPMVSSTRISAALLDHRLFDQSIVGVFPHDPSWTAYLLGFFNSPTCNRLIRTLNPSANNPANYIKKIPFCEPGAALKKDITELVHRIVDCARRGGDYAVEWEQEVHERFREVYGF